MTHGDDPRHVVFVCTANQCRSPMAEGLLRRELVERGVTDVAVSSAGLFEDGMSATPDSVSAVRRYGVDLSHHRSRALSGDVVDSADLVLAMTGAHVAEVLALRPDAARRTFTLADLVDRAETVGPRPPGEPLPAYLSRLSHPGASGASGDSDGRDIPDPVGRGGEVYAATAAKLDALVGRLTALLWAEGGGR